MATPYNTNLKEKLGSYQDRVFDGVALPNATSIESGVFQYAKVQAEVELAIIAVDEITIADGQSLTFEVFYDDAEDGSFTNSYVAKAYLASGSAIVISAGDTVMLDTPESNIGQYAKVKVTATADQSGASIDGKLFRIA